MYLDGTSFLKIVDPLLAPTRNVAIVVVVSAILSTSAFAFAALGIILDATIGSTSRRPKILFFRTQLGHYTACLVLSNLFISIAGLIDIGWLRSSGLSPGLTCSAQAVLMQIGVWSTCWFTVAHGVQTLISFIFCVCRVYWISVVTVFIGWMIACVAALAPMQKENLYGPAGISCSITSSYPNEMFFLGALPIILSAFVVTVIYSFIFIVLRKYRNGLVKRKLRGLSLAYRPGEDKATEYRGFINVIIWTMFWFPLAFVVFMSPYCIVRILVYAGHTVPSVLSAFADGCASLLGFINITLLLNTFRLISYMSCAPGIETMSFGHDASGEAPMTPSYERNHRTHDPTLASHSHSSSCSSVDSNTGLMCTEKTLHAPTQSKATPLELHIIPPAELGRQLDSEPGITSPGTIAKRNVVCLGKVDSPSRMAHVSLGPPPRVARWTSVTMHKPGTWDEKFLLQLAGDDEPSNDGENLWRGSQAPLEADLSDLPARPPVSYPGVDKVTMPHATTLGTFDASSPITPQFQATLFSHKSTTPRTSFTSTRRPTSDSDSSYSGELVHAYKVRLGSQVPHPDGDEKCVDDILFPGPQHRFDMARRATISTIWSQDSENMTDEEIQEAYWQLVAELLGDLGVTLDEQTDVSGGISRQSTFGPRDVRPVTLRIQPRVKGVSEYSVQLVGTSPLSHKGVCS